MDEAGETNVQVMTGLIGEAERIAVDALYSERGHYAAAGVWRRRHYWLSGPAALLAIAAGGSFLTKNAPEWLPPLLAFISALLSALSAFLKPDALASEHHAAGVRFATIRKKLRLFIHAGVQAASLNEKDLLEQLDALRSDYAGVQASAREIPGWAYGRAKAGIEGGEAGYTEQEIEAATGRPPA